MMIIRLLTLPKLWLIFLILLLSGIGSPNSAQAQVVTNRPSTSNVRPSYSDYILGPGDAISINVFGYDEYNKGPTVIEPNGTITLPVIGVITVAGKTSEAIARELTSRLNYYLIDPAVAVTITSLRPIFVTVGGEVQRPGPIQLRSPNASANGNGNGAQTGLPTLSAGLVQAGGVTSYADIRQVQMRRSLPNGQEVTRTVNLWEALSSESSSENPLLQDGDTIFVPRLTADSTIDPRLVARSSLAPDTIRVRVVGEVTKPGEVLVPPNSSLSSAVAIAGGPTEDARLSHTTFIRLNQEGAIERQEVDLSDLTDGYQVQDGDVIMVPKSNSSSVLDTANRVFNPLNFVLRLFGL